LWLIVLVFPISRDSGDDGDSGDYPISVISVYQW
jgi:hypothetical protein